MSSFTVHTDAVPNQAATLKRAREDDIDREPLQEIASNKRVDQGLTPSGKIQQLNVSNGLNTPPVGVFASAEPSVKEAPVAVVEKEVNEQAPPPPQQQQQPLFSFGKGIALDSQKFFILCSAHHYKFFELCISDEEYRANALFNVCKAYQLKFYSPDKPLVLTPPFLKYHLYSWLLKDGGASAKALGITPADAKTLKLFAQETERRCYEGFVFQPSDAGTLSTLKKGCTKYARLLVKQMKEFNDWKGSTLGYAKWSPPCDYHFLAVNPPKKDSTITAVEVPVPEPEPPKPYVPEMSAEEAAQNRKVVMLSLKLGREIDLEKCKDWFHPHFISLEEFDTLFQEQFKHYNTERKSNCLVCESGCYLDQTLPSERDLDRFSTSYMSDVVSLVVRQDEIHAKRLEEDHKKMELEMQQMENLLKRMSGQR